MRRFTTRLGNLDLEILRAWSGESQPSFFEREPRSEQAFVAALVETSVRGVSTRKVSAVVETFRRRPGFLRAALRKSLGDPSVWEPLRAHGHFVADQFVARLSRDTGRHPSPDGEMRIRFAFQIMNGTLINALVNAPGPLQIDHPTLTAELVRAMRLVMVAESQPRNVESISRS